MTDPTMQTTGPMTSYIEFDNGTGGYMRQSQVTLEYFPHDAPPPPWTEGTQWTNLTSKIGQFGVKVPANVASPVLEVTDRSSQSIPLGKAYLFTQHVQLWQTYFEIHGVQGGSTCLPGIGLYNLISNPNAWTIIKPQTFDGTWAVSWLSPTSIAPITVSVTYAPAQDTLPTSRLIYSYSSTPLYAPWLNAPDTDDSAAVLIDPETHVVGTMG